MLEDDFKCMDLEEAIIKVIAFFDIFDYPLTAIEIWKYLDSKRDLSEITLALSRMSSENRSISEEAGFYFLCGRNSNVSSRLRRFNYSQAKIRIARRFASLFRLFPGVKMVAIVNSFGPFNMREESDIDFFIITAAKRIWLSRLFCTGLAAILHSRPDGKRKKNRACLSFYLSEEDLDLSRFKLDGEIDDFRYWDYWRKSMVILYNRNSLYEEFEAANDKKFKRSQPIPGNGLFLMLIDNCEQAAKALQLKIMLPALRSGMSEGVAIDDQVLKLYLHDRRREYLKKYGDKISSIL